MSSVDIESSAAIYQDRQALTWMRRKLVQFAVSTFLTATLFMISFWAIWGLPFAIRWYTLALGGVVVLFLALNRNLEKNRPGTGYPISTEFGAGTGMTIFRGVLLAFLVGFLAVPRPTGIGAWLPGVIFCLIVAADFLDGYLARLTGQETELGAWLDLQLDGLGVLIGSLLAILYGQVPIWYLLVGLARYLYVAGIWLRKTANLPVHDLPYSFRRRHFAGFQLGFIGVILLPLFSPPGTFVAAGVFMVPFLAGFLYDWFLVCYGEGSRFERSFLALRNRTQGLLLLLPRALAVLLLAAGVADHLLAWIPIAVFPVLRLPAAVTATELQVLIELLLLALLAFGIAGRVAAIGVLVLLGIYQMAGPLAFSQNLLGAAAIIIFFLGTGPYSLWEPENRLIYRQAGKR